MKDRIRKLYIQTANETADGKEWAIGGMNNAERFAELIIEESIRVMDKHDYHAVWLGEKIKEHFGVE